MHKNNGIAHERLAIIDPESGDQPLYSADGNFIVAANGEIYNYKEIYATLEIPYIPTTGSDCESIIPLALSGAPVEELPSRLRGMFSVIIYDKRDGSFYAFRDHLGKTPLYMGWAADGSTWLSSEMKGLSANCVRFECFPPGHTFSSKTGAMTRWYNPPWMNPSSPFSSFDAVALREAFTNAVRRRMMSDVPWGVLLSGGLDSSLVAAVASRIQKANGGRKLHSFCVGLENSPDIQAAKKVADFLGTEHHSYTYTIQEGLDAIPEAIYHIETYDTTTVRASTPMYLMSRKIKAMGITMVLSGEGSDEIFAGYLYFHKAPNPEELQAELRDKLCALNKFDCLRANKSTCV